MVTGTRNNMDTKELGDYLLHKADVPFVLKGIIDTWPARQWTPQSLHEEMQSQKIRFRIGKKSLDDVQWETECCFVEASIGDFLQWLSGSCSHDNPLASYPSNQYWCYADYKYMAHMFADKPHMLQAIDWSKFGFPGRDGQDSTWWMGSQGAYTVCHYDTYGCNLVAQIYGRKHWTLFVPESTPYLYPTRIPYEESSVFSQVNIKNPNLCKHPKFTMSAAYSVTLEPGDVLFVPHQWWHHVESLETSISVNTWIELEQDKRERLHESVTRLLACSVLPQAASTMDGDNGHPSPDESLASWLNPTEEATSCNQNMSYIKQCLEQLAEDSRKLSSQPVENPDVTEQCSCDDVSKIHVKRNIVEPIGANEEPLVKKHKHCEGVACSCGLNTTCRKTIINEQFERMHVVHVARNPNFHTEWIIPCGASDESWGKSSEIKCEISHRNILNSILNPNVIDRICENMLDNFK